MHWTLQSEVHRVLWIGLLLNSLTECLAVHYSGQPSTTPYRRLNGKLLVKIFYFSIYFNYARPTIAYSLRQSPFLPFLLVDSPGDAHPLPNILMPFIKSNILLKSTLMFNVLQKSACMQSSATVVRTDNMDYRPCIGVWH